LQKRKRGAADISDYIELQNLVAQIVKLKPHKYNVQNEKKQCRDRALLALLAATGLRISEALSIETRMFNLTGYTGFIVIEGVQILKRWNRRYEVNPETKKKKCVEKWRQNIKKDFPLPKTGVLKPVTDLIMAQYRAVKKGRLIDLRRRQAYEIVNEMTGKWCHYFRSQRISYLVHKIRGTVPVADIMGIKAPQTIAHYYKGKWREYEEEMKGD